MTPALSPDQWGLAWQLFQAAAELPAVERHPFLNTSTNDPAVIRQVLELLENSGEDSAPAASVLRSRTQVSHYCVGERIGRGGMGEVHEALDLELDRSVAIKFLPEHVLSDERAVRLPISPASLTTSAGERSADKAGAPSSRQDISVWPLRLKPQAE